MNDVEQMIVSQEGTGPMNNGRFFPYADVVQKMTIGYGHNLEDKGIPADVALELLKVDILDAIEDVRHCFSCYDQLSRPRQLVLISMAYNLGRDRLMKFQRFIGAVHRGDWHDAADEMLDSKWAPQVGSRAIVLSQMMRESTSQWV